MPPLIFPRRIHPSVRFAGRPNVDTPAPADPAPPPHWVFSLPGSPIHTPTRLFRRGFIPPTNPEPDTSIPPPQASGAREIPLVPRDPRVAPASRRHEEVVQAILNDLIRRRDIEFLGGTKWRLAIHRWVASRPPTVNDDEEDGVRVADFWFDQSVNALYINTSASFGAAEWLFLAGGSGLTGLFPPGGGGQVFRSITLAGGLVTDIQFQDPATAAPPYPQSDFATLTDAAIVTVDLQAHNKFRLTATSAVGASRGFALINSPAQDHAVIVRFTQDAVGGRTLSWTGFGTVTWLGAATGTPASGANAVTVFSLNRTGAGLWDGFQV